MKSGFGSQALPSQTVVMALSMSVTVLAMSPVLEKMGARIEKIDPKSFQSMTDEQTRQSLIEVLEPWKEFLGRRAGRKELLVLASITGKKDVAVDIVSPSDRIREAAGSWRLLIPAFILAELKSGMMMGFSLLLPFLLVDLLVANLLPGLGMYMLSPVSISLPLKLLLFAYSDGWLLLTESLIRSSLAT
jgi:flagellar biosynthetic protein FliP